MNRTPIPWVKNPDGSQGYTWNPITGCLNGCEYCYARKLANGRLKSLYLANRNISPAHASQGAYNKALTYGNPFYPRFWEDRECSPIRRNIYKGHKRKARGIFTCDMSDLFGIGIPEKWIRHILTTIQCCPIDRFYLLTKQPQNLAKFSPFPENCWPGVTATDGHRFVEALNYLIKIQAKVIYLSLEPLLDWHIEADVVCRDLRAQQVDWLIIGSCTGTKKDMEELIKQYPDLTLMPFGKKWSAQPKIE